jgi:hypothetical protein
VFEFTENNFQMEVSAVVIALCVILALSFYFTKNRKKKIPEVLIKYEKWKKEKEEKRRRILDSTLR